MGADVLPYLVPSQEVVTWEPWTYWDGEDWPPLPDAIDGWDPGTDIHVSRYVRIDTARLLEDTRLQPHDLAIVTSWTSSTSGMTEAAPRAPLDHSGVTKTDGTLRGDRIGGVLRLRCTLMLTSTPATQTPGVAWLAGSILSEHQHRLALEGALSMFPVHDVDFSHTSLPPEASWHLETSTELTAPFLGTFRLLINNRDGELMTAAARGTKDKRQQALCDELEHGVAMMLLELAIMLRADLADRDNWPPDTVGDVLSRTLAAAEQSNLVPAPNGPYDVATFRTRLAAATRATGHGRSFR
jgi:hypothetical protein